MSDEEKKDEKPHPLAITKKQEALFDAMVESDSLCLVGGKYRDEQVSFVCLVFPDGQGGANIRPIAILMDDEFITRHRKDIQDPELGVEEHPSTSPGSSEKN